MSKSHTDTDEQTTPSGTARYMLPPRESSQVWISPKRRKRLVSKYERRIAGAAAAIHKVVAELKIKGFDQASVELTPEGAVLYLGRKEQVHLGGVLPIPENALLRTGSKA